MGNFYLTNFDELWWSTQSNYVRRYWSSRFILIELLSENCFDGLIGNIEVTASKERQKGLR